MPPLYIIHDPRVHQHTSRAARFLALPRRSPSRPRRRTLESPRRRPVRLDGLNRRYVNSCGKGLDEGVENFRRPSSRHRHTANTVSGLVPHERGTVTAGTRIPDCTVRPVVDAFAGLGHALVPSTRFRRPRDELFPRFLAALVRRRVDRGLPLGGGASFHNAFRTGLFKFASARVDEVARGLRILAGAAVLRALHRSGRRACLVLGATGSPNLALPESGPSAVRGQRGLQRQSSGTNSARARRIGTS